MENELLWVAIKNLFKNDEDITALLDLPCSGSNKDIPESYQKLKKWLIDYNLYQNEDIHTQLIQKEWFIDPRNYKWPGLSSHYKNEKPQQNKKSAKAHESVIKISKTICQLSDLLNSSPGTLERTLSKNRFISSNRPHLWIMGLLNSLNEHHPDEDIILYSMRTKIGIKKGWDRLKSNIENNRQDIWDLTFITSIICQYHHKRDTQDVRSNKGKKIPRADTPRPIANLKNITLEKTAIIKIIEWLSNPEISQNLSSTITRSIFENFLLEAHVKPHKPRKKRNTTQNNTEKDEALKYLEDADQIAKSIKNNLPHVNIDAFLAKIMSMRRYAIKSKDQASDIELKLAEISPHFRIFNYLHEVHRGEQRERWESWLNEAEQELQNDAEGLIMYGPLIASKRSKISELNNDKE
jgi:hypothetical protein